MDFGGRIYKKDVEKVLLTFRKIQAILNYRAAGELAVP